MKIFSLLAALLMIGNIAMAEETGHGSARLIPLAGGGAGGLEIKGSAAHILYLQMTSVKEVAQAVSSTDDVVSATLRFGKNVSCLKLEKKSDAAEYICQFGILDQDGSISEPPRG